MSDEINVDQLLENIEGESDSGIPMEAEPVEETPVEETHTLNWNGQEVQANQEQLTQWAQQGYDYAQKIAGFKSQQDEFNQQRSQYQDQLSKYTDIDRYAAENPDWWRHVEESWNGRDTQLDTLNDPVAQELNGLKEQISELHKFKTDLVSQKEAETRTQEDEVLNQDILSMRDQYKHLDWDSKNHIGDNLETQVLRYANEQGLNNFAQAFKLFNHDRLISLAQEQAKETTAKTLQQQTKLGLLGKEPKQEGFRENKNPKSQSYDDLVAEALEELGAGA